MKKSLVLVLIILMATPMLFSEVVFNGWGRGVLTVGGGVSTPDDAVRIASSKSWWSNAVRTGWGIGLNTEDVGMHVAYDVDGTEQAIGDAYIWVKPIDMVTMRIGEFNDDTLRGNSVFGSWDYVRYQTDIMAGEDHTFKRFDGTGNLGAFEIAVEPTEGLYAFAGINGIAGTDNSGAALEDVMKTAQVGAGYTVGEMAKIKVQYWGETTAGGDDSGWVNAAVDVTAVENLFASVGVFAPLNKDLGDMSLGVFGKYNVAGATLYGTFTSTFADDMPMEIAVGADYPVGGLTLKGDVRYYNEFGAAPDNGIGVTLFAQKGLASGHVSAGIEVTNTGFPVAGLLAGNKENPDDIVWAIPIRMEYYF